MTITTMRRVSSRQRLVSWDAFDATTAAGGGGNRQDHDNDDDIDDDNDNDNDSEEYSDYDTEPDPPVTTTLQEEPSPFLTPCSSLDQILNAPCTSLTTSLTANTNTSTTTSTSTSTRWHRRKRERIHVIRSNQKQEAPVAISISTAARSSDEMDQEEEEASPHDPSFMDLVDDVQLAIFSFLDLTNLRSLLSTSKRLRRFLCGNQAHHIWMTHCQKHWTPIHNHLNNTIDAKQLCDHSQLPTAINTFERHSLNLPLLLSMTPDKLPTCIDKSLVQLPSRGRHHSSRSQLTLTDYQDESDVLVQFNGRVGTGDRCIRANQPLPRPRHISDRRWDHRMGMGMSMGMGMGGGNPSLLDFLCRGAQAVAGRAMHAWRPFVSPYIEQDGSLQCMPRMVSYYEVSILENDNNNNNNENVLDDDDDRSLPPHQQQQQPPAAGSTIRPHASDCVAVGLATHSFHLHSRMPGWDCLSFGYHGDDGGIFHASGGMVKHFGPSFGVGDTVGCGIDYVHQAIFFTLNGKFLGYAWKGINVEFLQNDIYPVVGIDTNHNIYANYGGGAQPFQFNLTSFCAQHEPLIQLGYQLKPYTIPKTTTTTTTTNNITTTVASAKAPKRKSRTKRIINGNNNSSSSRPW